MGVSYGGSARKLGFGGKHAKSYMRMTRGRMLTFRLDVHGSDLCNVSNDNGHIRSMFFSCYRTQADIRKNWVVILQIARMLTRRMLASRAYAISKQAFAPLY
jgi:hypothetical protein